MEYGQAMERSMLINAPLGKSIACIAFETLARMNSKPRNPEIKVTVTRPSKTTPITKFEDCDTNLQNKVTRFLKSRNTVKEFSGTLGKKARELSEEEKTVREDLVNHLMNVENHSETVEMELPKRLVDKKKKEKEKKKKAEKNNDGDDEDADTIDDFDDSQFPELLAAPSTAAHAVAEPAALSTLEPSRFFDEFSFTDIVGTDNAVTYDKEKDEKDEEESDNETVNSKFNVAIEARKRHVGKITSSEFKTIFELITSEILKDNFRLDPAAPYEETILRTCLSSDLFWSNLFVNLNKVLEKEQSEKVDDKLVLYIRNQKT